MTPPISRETELAAIQTLRFLAVDMVEAAKSGHPGAPLGLAPLAFSLWTRHLRFDPADPAWADRDRFVLSCGHASALLYGLLHLAGYDLPLDELRRFRQLGSRTPGHPEHGHTAGVETTTGPLGQGVATAVGMAMARRHLAARFDREGFALFDHRIWVLASRRRPDGGRRLGGGLARRPPPPRRAQGPLRRQPDLDRRPDLARLQRGRRGPLRRLRLARPAGRRRQRPRRARRRARRRRGRGRAADAGRGPHPHRLRQPDKQDTAEAHGAPLGAEAARATKRALGWPEEPVVPGSRRGPRALRRGRRARRARRRAAWRARLAALPRRAPRAGAELERRLAGELPAAGTPTCRPTPPARPGSPPAPPPARRSRALAARLPELVGGSADLAESNNTPISGAAAFSAAHPEGRNFHFGVREHAMGAILNGLALSGLLRPYGGTFLIFSDYMRPAIRLAALMRLPVVYVFTHDSIFLGEDGPTHQPVEQLAALRAIPGLVVLRPADARETAAAWRVALARREGPTALALTRQKLPLLEASAAGAERRGRPGRLRRPRDAGRGSRRSCCCSRAARRSRWRSRPPRSSPRAASRRASSRSPRGSCSPGRRAPIGTPSCRPRSPPGSPSRRAAPSAGTAGSATGARWSASRASAPRRRPRPSPGISGSPPRPWRSGPRP